MEGIYVEFEINISIHNICIYICISILVIDARIMTKLAITIVALNSKTVSRFVPHKLGMKSYARVAPEQLRELMRKCQDTCGRK